MSLFWQTIIVFCISLFLFSLTQFPHTFYDPDGFYHAKISETIAERGLVKSFPWTQFATLKDGFVDHHLGFHLLIAPLTKIFPSEYALKLGNLFINSAFVSVFFLFLKKNKIKYSWLFTSFLFLTAPLYARLSMNKAIGLALLLLMFFIWALMAEKKWPLFFISALFVCSYGGWPISIIVLICYIVARILFQIVENKKMDKKLKNHLLGAACLTLAGLAAGLVINPYFPQNLNFYWQQVVQIGLINYQNQLNVGSEWLPYDFITLAAGTFFLWGILIFSLKAIMDQKAKLNWRHIFLTFSFIIFFAVTLKSRRYIEYFAPFFILYIAFLSRELDLKKLLGGLGVKMKWFCLSLTALLAGLILANFSSTIQIFQTKHSVDKFSGAAAWLAENTAEGSIVFHTDWDDFPMLWFHNDRNYYIGGLDPTFTYLFNPELSKKWMSISSGSQADELYLIIKNDFQANYVFVEKNNHALFLNNLENNFLAEKKFEDAESAIFHLKNND